MATTQSSTSSSSKITMNDNRSGSNHNNNNGASKGDHQMEESSSSLAYQQQLQQQQQQQQQHLRESSRGPPETQSSAVTAFEPDGNGNNRQSETPLPADLRRILLEVAKTGACSWLSWDQAEEKDHRLGSSYAGLVEGGGGGGGGPAAPQTGSVSGVFLGGVATTSKLSFAAGAGTSTSRQPFLSNRLAPSSSFVASSSQQPPRKRHRNGLHKTTRRRFGADGSATQTTTGVGGRKRPLFLIRTTAGNNNNNNNSTSNALSAGSVGSGRTSGSEPDDSTQYECDSEGTSATTNSEVSVERLRKTQRLVRTTTPAKRPAQANLDDSVGSQHVRYKTLQEALRVALGLVLDHFYRQRGGYKLSPAEKRRNTKLHAKTDKEKQGSGSLSADAIYEQRRLRLLNMLVPDKNGDDRQHANDGPPFTIQRIAEVLVSPERVSKKMFVFVPGEWIRILRRR